MEVIVLLTSPLRDRTLNLENLSLSVRKGPRSKIRLDDLVFPVEYRGSYRRPHL